MRIKEVMFVLLIAGLQFGTIQEANAAESFVVSDIELVGLQRISEGTVLNYLPVREGDTVTPDDVSSSIRALFRSGFFNDVAVRRDGTALIFVVQERPTIAEFNITGNKDIETEQLEKILRGEGMATGRVFERSVLDAVTSELERMYHSRGKYNVIIDYIVDELANNLVEIDLDIKEGQVSRIKAINIVGNEQFDDERLFEEIELKPSSFWSFISSDDQYAREKLLGDIESLKSFYLDRGYADFQVENIQVSLSPDKQDVFLTFILAEGDIYTVSGSELMGNLIVPAEQLERMILLKPGETFSQRMAEAGAQFMARRLEAEGYAFADVEPVPDVNREDRTVNVIYRVDPGRRIGVRSVVFKGAPGTNDEVYRRQMRQFEGAWLSNARLERSKVRIERMPFVERVESETVPVDGEDDLVDVEFNIAERSAGEFQVGVGYAGSATGLMGNVAVSHANFLGSGESVKLDLSSTSFQKTFSVTHGDPYSTIDGINRNTSVYYIERDSLARGFEQFTTETIGLSLDYTYPVSEYASVGWGVQASSNEVATQIPGASLSLENFMLDPAHGDVTLIPLVPRQEFPNIPAYLAGLDYTEFGVSLRAGYDSRNRSIFATRGAQRSLRFTLVGAPGDIEYYSLNTTMRDFFGLGAGHTLTTRLDLALTDTYGSSSALPPSRRLLAGGFDTIRAFRESYLGPRDVNVFDPNTGELIHVGTGTPIGGKFRTFVQAELLLPNYFADDPDAPAESSQFGIFIDAGNLYESPSDFTFDDWRVSAGIAATFLTPVGALRFAFGVPISYEDGDELERFQFTIGSIF